MKIALSAVAIAAIATFSFGCEEKKTTPPATGGTAPTVEVKVEAPKVEAPATTAPPAEAPKAAEPTK